VKGADTTRTVALVTTTIRVPIALENYLRQFAVMGRRNVRVVIVGDRKTPDSIGPWVRDLAAFGFPIDYLGPSEQTDWLRAYPDLARLLPWNSIQRRNIGYLFAAERGADVLISIDDDNHVLDEDFIAAHCIVGSEVELTELASSTGWFNICELLQTDSQLTATHRGFPHQHRHEMPRLAVKRVHRRVAVNAGLWVGDPDVDAATRLVAPVSVTCVKNDYPFPVTLAPGSWCPFNSQNTAFSAELLPCMYLVVMGGSYRRMRVARYDDIWMSYFVRRIADHLGHSVAYGHPIVRQVRNDHDVLEDLAGELPGMMLTPALLSALSEITLHGGSYNDCYFELIDALRSVRWGPDTKDFFRDMLDGMEIWARACEPIVAA
jgi:hypothetical protein